MGSRSLTGEMQKVPAKEPFWEPLVVFVPGFLGSSLWCGGTARPEPGKWEEVWGENAWMSARTLVKSIRQLESSEMEPRRVIRHFSLGKFRVHDVYGSLLDFCTEPGGLGLRPGCFFEFPYDWRASVADTASLLQGFIQDVDPSGRRPIRFIAHSLGGLVVRVLLARFGELARRTQLLFQIASPVTGTQKAYDYLRHEQRFSSGLDAILQLVHRIAPSKAADLREIVMSFASLYELLPAGERTLVDVSDGCTHSPLSRQYWPSTSHPHLETAERTHAMLARPIPNVRTVRIYADAHSTLCLHHVDGTGQVRAWQEFKVGDATVIWRSACGCSASNDISLRQEGKQTRHVELCGNPRVWEILRAYMT